MQKKDLDLILQGKAPEDGAVLETLSVGEEDFTAFLKTQYLEEYIARGGSKIKFLTGRAGSGKDGKCLIIMQDM